MKYVKLFENFAEDNDFTFKEDSGQGKSTWVLKLGPQSWKKVKRLFDEDGRPKHPSVKKISNQIDRYAWDLHAQKYMQGGKEMHKIYGVCGDFTFGNAPTFYNQALRGNKKVAKEILSNFIEKYIQESYE